MRWFWFGLITSLGFLVSNQLLRLVFHPSAAAALSSLVGTSLALFLVSWFTSNERKYIQPTVVPLKVPAERTDPTPIIALGLGVAPAAPGNGNGNGKSASLPLTQELMPLGFHAAVEEFKRRLLVDAIATSGGNRAEAARRLGLQRTYLYRLTKQLSCGEPRAEAEDLPSV